MKVSNTNISNQFRLRNDDIPMNERRVKYIKRLLTETRSANHTQELIDLLDNDKVLYALKKDQINCLLSIIIIFKEAQYLYDNYGEIIGRHYIIFINYYLLIIIFIIYFHFIIILLLFIYLLGMDCTYSINKFKLPMLHILGKSANNESYTIGIAFLSGITILPFYHLTLYL